MTADQYDPPTAGVLEVVADEWMRQVEQNAPSAPHHPLLDVGDTVPPYVNEFDVGYRSVDTWHGGNPGPAIAVIRQALLDADAITRLRSSAIGALERKEVRWAVHHGITLPKPLSEHFHWEVTNVDRFEQTIGRFLRHSRTLPADVRAVTTDWAARPETNAGAPERGWLLDDFIALRQGLVQSDQVNTETRDNFLRWYIHTYKGMHTDFAEQLWRWLNAEGALRKPTPDERALLGVIPDDTRVWDRTRLVAALPELTINQ